MSVLRDLKFFATQPHTCSYLPEKQAVTLFMDPQTHLKPTIYSQLAEIGFRRSGQHIYRPHCQGCNACIPARVPVRQFVPRRSQRRNWKRNSDLVITQHEAGYNDEYYDLYKRYINGQHRDGDMYPPSIDQFKSFLVQCQEFCTFYQFRENDKLIAVAVTDKLANGLSAIYTFYDPEHNKRSLGRYCILWQIEETRRLGLDYLHLGYWIKDCKKMSYKMQYRPLEIYINNHWVLVK